MVFDFVSLLGVIYSEFLSLMCMFVFCVVLIVVSGIWLCLVLRIDYM